MKELKLKKTFNSFVTTFIILLIFNLSSTKIYSQINKNSEIEIISSKVSVLDENEFLKFEKIFFNNGNYLHLKLIKNKKEKRSTLKRPKLINYKFIVDRFDENLNLIDSYSTEVKMKWFRGFYLNEKELGIIHSDYEKDIFSLLKIGSPINENQFKQKVIYTQKDKKLDINSGNIAIGNNQIVFSIKRKVKKELFKSFIFFNSSLKKIVSKKIKIDKKDRYNKASSLIVSDSDTSYYELDKFSKSSNRKEFTIRKIDINGVKVKKIDSDSIGNLGIYKKNDKIYCIGFTRRKNPFVGRATVDGINEYKGVVFYEFDKNLNLIRENSATFNQELIDSQDAGSVHGFKYKPNGLILNDFVGRELYVNDKNEIYLTGENFFRQLYQGAMPNKPATQPLYNYNNIYTFKFNEDGEMLWARVLNRVQYSRYHKSYFSYKTIFKNDSLYYLFFYSELKEKSKGLKYLNDGKGNQTLALITYNSVGDLKSKNIKVYDKNEGKPAIGRGSINDNTILSYIYSKNRIKIVGFKLE